MSAQEIDLEDVLDVVALAIDRTQNARETLSVLSLAVSIVAIKCDSKPEEFSQAMGRSYAEAQRIIEGGLLRELTFDVMQ